MKLGQKICIVSLLLSAFTSSFILSSAHYLSVSSRWLVHEVDGSRAKLACVNWAGHLEPMLPEGLHKQPLHRISSAIRSFGFNCVRLTWATNMFVDAAFGNQTVNQACTSLKLHNILRGITVHNPDLVELSLVDAFKRVVSSLAQVGVLIILDNHVSRPQWCCSDKDGNGFWGDRFFDAGIWIEGLSTVASTFKDWPEVVGMSLRNELRGSRQNAEDWYKYMSLGATAVHDANPELIVILSGLHYDTDLHFYANDQLDLPFRNKIVFEMHWYASSYGVNFAQGNLNRACSIATSTIMKCGGFVTTPNASYTAPLFISEFGMDQRGGNKDSNRFINCLFAFAASMDLDWSYWPLQGTYYIRNGHQDDEEFYGILNARWSSPRNVSFLARLQAIQQPWLQQDPSRRTYQILFHPATGLCLQKGPGNTLLLRSCVDSKTQWRYTPQGRIEMVGSYLCVAAEGEGQAARLEVTGTEKHGSWAKVSVAKLQFATTIRNERKLKHNAILLCLDGRSAPSVITSKCVCVREDDMDCGYEDDPSSQWFVLITTSNRAMSSIRESTTLLQGTQPELLTYGNTGLMALSK